MTLPPPAGLTGPVNNATGVTTSTPFEFTTSANQVYQVSVESSTAIYVIYTTSGSLTIPQSRTWQVVGYGPLANIDTAADTTALNPVSTFESTGSLHSTTTSPERNFTTQ